MPGRKVGIVHFSVAFVSRPGARIFFFFFFMLLAYTISFAWIGAHIH